MEKKYCEVRRILFTFLSSHGLNAELGVVKYYVRTLRLRSKVLAGQDIEQEECNNALRVTRIRRVK